MKLRQYIFKLYWLGLHLYPKDFRQAHGEEMLMAAYSMLQLPITRRDTLHLALRLGWDLGVTATQSRAKQLLVLATDKTWLSQAAMGTLKTIAILLATALVTLPILAAYSFMYDRWLWYIELAIAAVPASMIFFAFSFLRRTPGLSLWSRLKWAYLLGLCGDAVFVALSVVDSWIAAPAYPQFLHLWGSTFLAFAHGREFVLAAIVCICLYITTRKVRGRLHVAG